MVLTGSIAIQIFLIPANLFMAASLRRNHFIRGAGGGFGFTVTVLLISIFHEFAITNNEKYYLPG
ncbi:MAG TPA: hypothetical protein PLA68_04555 [Panacibacter sp.]|nr:hypothetical protein [Panacibacter sp.]